MASSIYIQLHSDDKLIMRKLIESGDEPEYHFKTEKGKKVEAFSFCNLHGMFKYTL